MSVQLPQPNYIQLIENAKLRNTTCELPTARIIQESHQHAPKGAPGHFRQTLQNARRELQKVQH